MKKFLLKNWFNVVTLVISVIAIIVAYLSLMTAREANVLTLANSSPNLIILDKEVNEPKLIIINGCKASSKQKYVISRQMSDKFSFANNGGRAVSLVEVKFTEGDFTYKDVKIYDKNSYQYKDVEPLILPLTIEAGNAVAWFFDSKYNSFWDYDYKTHDEAFIAIENSTNKPMYYTWEFEFSDRTVLKFTYPVKWSGYSTNPNIDGALEEECSF